MTTQQSYLSTIERVGQAYILKKPYEAWREVKYQEKHLPFLSIPGRIGWQRMSDENGKLTGWSTTDIHVVLQTIDLEYIGATEAVLNDIQSANNINALSRAVSTTAEVVINNLNGFKLRPYQAAGVMFIERAFERGKGAINIDEVGLGKTAQALVVALRAKPKRLLIICPANVRYNWVKEIKNWMTSPDSPIVTETVFSESGYSIDMDLIDVVNGVRPPDDKAMIVICSFDLFSRNKRVAQQYIDEEWDMIIIDEAHYLKNKGSNRSLRIRELKSPKRLCLTATPMETVDHIYPLNEWVDPDEIPDYAAFILKYGSGKPGATRATESLRSSVLIGRKKIDVAKELPPLTFDTIVLDIPGVMVHKGIQEHCQHMSIEIENLKIRAAEMIKKDPDNTAVRERIRKEYTSLMKRMGRIRGISPDLIAEHRVEAGLAKADFVVEKAIDITHSSHRVIVGYHHKVVGMEIMARLEKEFPGTVEKIDGSIKSQKREAIKERFDSGDTRIIMASITAAATGINLQAASNIIMAEIDWSGANNYQFAGRIHRIGQDNPCYVMIPVVSGTIDQHIMSVQSGKQEIMQIIQE